MADRRNKDKHVRTVAIVGGGALGLGLLVPFIFYRLRKPSWRQPEPQGEVATS